MTTLLPDTIKFRYLINQLTKQEYTEFLNKLVVENKISLITSSLFHYFTQTIHAKANQISDDLDDVNSILTNIIQSRKNKQKVQSIVNIKLNELPKAIIGYIASNLEQNDYFNFAQTNRSIFIGCNTPNMLIELDLKYIRDYSSINLAQFRSLKRLRVDLTKFNEFILPNNGTFIMNKLINLSLVANYKGNLDIESFINQKCINMKNIKSLAMREFGYNQTGRRFNMDKLYRLMAIFSNVECIHLFNMCFEMQTAEVNAYASKVKQLCPNVVGLSVVGGSFLVTNALVTAFGNNLHGLVHLIPTTVNQLADFSNTNFSNLTQLQLRGGSAKTINDILKTSQNVQTVVIHPYFAGKLSLNSEELKTIIPKILKFKSLQYLEIEANDETFDGILNGIGKGLFETIKYKRKEIKIRICAQTKSKIDISKMIFNIGTVIHWLLESSNLKNFMLILDMSKIKKNVANKYNKDKILNNMCNMSSNVKIVSGNGLIFVVTNKNCTINGFGKRCQFTPTWIKM